MGVTAAERDRKLGGRVRRKWNRIVATGESFGLTADQIRGAVDMGWLTATPAERKKIAKALGFDWESAAAFFAAILPIILELLAAC